MHPTTQSPAQLPVKPAATAATTSAEDKAEPLQSPMANVSMKEAVAQAASIGAARKGPTPGINDTKVAPLKSSLAEADAATKPESMNSSSDTKLESIHTAEDTAAQTSDAPAPEKTEETSTTPSSAPSAVVESDDISATITPAGSMVQKHRGSSVSIADPETIKDLEKSIAIPEEEDEDEEQPKTQDQEAAVAEKASVSVQD